MLRLHLFGGLSLLDGTAPLSGPATQRRRLALLARLAASPDASASRDKLIGCFWPEEDRERARHHLADSVFTLRKSLGKDIVLTVGDDLILNGEALSCDVWQFHAALAAGDPETAVELYRGPFLDGFFVGDAPEFERWVEEERARLARLYAEGLESLALAREGQGEPSQAVQWWKRLAAQDPASSRVALRLMQALARSGERAAALQHAKIHATLLREEFDLPPDPLIEALAAELASAPPPPTQVAAAPLEERMFAPAPPPTSVDARREEPEPVESLAPPAPPAAGAGAPGISPPAPRPPSTRRRRRRFLRRNSVVAFSLLLLTLLVAAVMWTREWLPPSWLLPPGETVASEVITIAVMPFDYRGSADYAFYGTGMVTLLGISLDGAGRIRTADTNAILSRASDAGESTPLSLDAAAAIAAGLEADFFLAGSLVETDGRFEMVVSLYPAEPDPVAAWTESATGTEISTLVYDIARLLLVEQLDAPADRLTRMAMLTNAPLPALKAYFQGEQEFRAARYERAAEYLEEAVREDPSFALAYYRLSMAEEWRFRFREARSAAEEAQALAGRVEGGARRLITAWYRFVHGDPEIAEGLYHAELTEDPFDVEALSGLGEVQVHFNPVRGLPGDQAVPTLRKVLERAPDFGEARFHLMEFAARAENRAEFDSLLAGVDPLSPQLLAWQAARAAAWPETVASDSVLEAVRNAEDVVAGIAAVRAAVNFRDIRAGQELARLLTRSDRPQPWQAAGHILVAQGHLALGEWAAADSALDAAMDVEPGWALEMKALGLLLPDAHATAEQLGRVRSALATWDPRRSNPETAFFFLAHADVHAELRLYLLALLSLHLGDDASAQSYARELQATGRYRDAHEIGRSLSLSIEAHRALHHDDPERALRFLERGQLKAPLELITLSPFYARALDRYLRAEAAAAAGRPEDARRWYSSLIDGPDLLFWSAAQSRLDELSR